jgi:4-amino-4-deoxy-L-arabinose transferase-like glycosyltransferase
MSVPRIRWLGAATAIIVVALYFETGIFDHGIWLPAEPAFAGVVWNMFRGGSLAVPRIDDFYYVEKPPLSYWLGWLSCKAVGKLDAGCMRFPMAVLGVLCLCIVYWIANKRSGTWIACITVFFKATSVEFYRSTHLAGNQSVGVFFVFLCFALFLRTLLKGNGADVKSDLAFLAALAVSFYAKNFFTFLIVLPPVVLFLLLKREYRRAARSVILLAIFTAVAIAPCVFALYDEGGLHYLRVVFFDNTFGRFFNLSHLERFAFGPLDDAFTVERNHPRYTYLLALFRQTAPWSLVFSAALIWLFRHRGDNNFKFFLKVAIISVPVLLTFSASRPKAILTHCYLSCF